MLHQWAFVIVAHMKMYDDDASLIAGCLANERRAWNTFVNTFTRYVYFMIETTRARYGAQLGEEDKADLHANIFMAFIEDDFRRLREFEGRNQCTLRSWIRMIAIRKTIDRLRKKAPKQISMEQLQEHKGFEPANTEDDALAQLLQVEDASRTPELSLLIAELSDKDQLLLRLFLVDKLKANEVARALNASVGAIYTRKTRLIERLRTAREKKQRNV